MNEKLKALREKAAKALADGRAIITLFEGKDMPQEKEVEMNKFFDEVDVCKKQIETLERAAAGERFLQDPLRLHPVGDGKTAKIDNPDEAEALAFKKKAFGKFLKSGTGALDANEIKALSSGDSTAGSYLVADTMLPELLEKSKSTVAMRRISRVLPPIVGGSSITPTVEDTLDDVEFTTEILSGPTDSSKPFGRRMLTPHPFAKLLKISDTLLRGSSINVESWTSEQFSYLFGKVEDNAFINGTGNNQPLGLLKTNGLTYTTTRVSNAIDGDDLIDWIYALPAAYAANARILCNRAFLRKVRKLKNAVDGQYVWQPGIQAGSPSSIIDTPYEISDQYDDGLDSNDAWEDNAVIAVVGDYRFYWIVDSLNFTIKRNDYLYMATNEVGFFGRKETDGQAVLAEAFKGLKIKA